MVRTPEGLTREGVFSSSMGFNRSCIDRAVKPQGHRQVLLPAVGPARVAPHATAGWVCTRNARQKLIARSGRSIGALPDGRRPSRSEPASLCSRQY